MTKFQFRLASVLRLRELELALEREKLDQMLGERTRLERSLASVAEERAEAHAFVRTRPNAGSTEFRALSAFLLGSDAREAALRQSIQRLEEVLAGQRTRVLAADRNERLLLKLKDKKLAEWRAENDRELETLAQESWLSTHRRGYHGSSGQS
jgi:flagellar export protein FliJ